MPLGQADGRWMDGQSARDHAVHATAEGSELVIYGEGGVVARWPIGSVKVDAMHEGAVFHVECSLAPDALLTLEDPAFVSTLVAHGAKTSSLLSGSKGLAIGLASFATLAALIAAVYWNASNISSAIARRIPISAERDIAPRMQTLFARNTCKTEKADAAIAVMMSRLDPEHRLDVDVRIVNLRMANAFALPGGVVILTRDLLEEADGADEVAGVLAHELAHVEHRHALSHMIRSALLGGIWAATLGDYSGFMVVDPKTAYETATLKFSREAEAEADEMALRTLTLRGISAQGLVNFLERNSKAEGKGMNFLSSHPASADRITKLSHQALAHKGEPVMDPAMFYELRKACESTPVVGSMRDLFF